MARVTFILFSIWFLMLPFSVISALYFPIAGLAVDKFMAPVLVLIWLGSLLAGKYTVSRKKFLLLIHLFIFIIVRNISFIDNAALFSELIWRDAIGFGYFMLPVLYVNNLKGVDVATRLVSVCAVVACVSAFLVAFGLIELPYARFEASRIGFEGIRKSIGVITSYGDVAQLAAFLLLLGLFLPDKILSVGRRAQTLIKYIVLLVIIAGFIGNQSRSYLLSLVVAYAAALFFSYRSKKSTNTMLVDILAILFCAFILPLMIFMIDEIASELGSLGGEGAIGTSIARLDQYEAAYRLIRENPLFGVGSEFYERNPDFAHGVHNLWLGQMVRGGIVSVLVLLSFLIVIFKAGIQLFKQDGTKYYAMVSTGYMAAVFVSTLFYPADTDIFWALLGMNAGIVFSLNSLFLNKIDKDAMHPCDENMSRTEPLERKILKRARKPLV